MNDRTLLKLVAVATLVLAGPFAAAQSGAGGWQFTLAPYAVAAAMDGAATVKGVEADVDVPFETLLEDLNMTLAELSRAKVRPEATGEE